MVLDTKDRILIKNLYKPKLKRCDQKLESSSIVVILLLAVLFCHYRSSGNAILCALFLQGTAIAVKNW